MSQKATHDFLIGSLLGEISRFRLGAHLASANGAMKSLPPAGYALESSNLIDPYARARHARYFENGIVYHTISRTQGNLFLLRPDEEGELTAITAGILAESRKNFSEVENYGTSVLSNHLHALLSVMKGDPRAIADYLAFIKRELSRRWKHKVSWTGSMWGRYVASAVITEQAQLRALKYVASQGVKENLVEKPMDWPGFHCAESLVTGQPVNGIWFDGTGYGKAVHAEKIKKNPQEVRREDYTYARTFTFDKLPALSHLDDGEYKNTMEEMVNEIIQEGREQRKSPVLGVQAICKASPRDSRDVPLPPWFEVRKRMIVWDNPGAPEVREYLDRYWGHQVAFREASHVWAKGAKEDTNAFTAFPKHSFVPGLRPRPIAHMEQSTA